MLLLLAALALAGAAGDWQVWRTGPVASALDADRSEPSVWFGPAAAPEHPALLGSPTAPRSSLGPRLLGSGPPVGHSRSTPFFTAVVPEPYYRLVARSLLAAERSRLGFAHPGAMSRSGAYSSFGTSLPPPLLA